VIVTETGVALLQEMLQIPSVTGAEARLATWLAGHLRKLGFQATRDQVGNVIATWGGGPAEVLLLGHIDTVPGEIPVRRADGRLWGRGAVDAKGPLAAAITAVSRQPATGPVRFTIIGAVAEEGDSHGAWHLKTRPAPAHLIVLEPSGWDAITLGYKGSMRVRYRLRQPAAHGAGPVPSAADHAVAFLRRLQDDVASEAAGKALFDRLDARVLSLSAGAVDGMSDAAEMLIGLRLPPGCDLQALQRRLLSFREDAELQFLDPLGAVRADKNTPLVRAFVQVIRTVGGTPRFKMKTGTSDMNILAPIWRCPSVAYGPGDSKLDHTPNEAIELQEFERGVAVLTEVLGRL